MTNTALLQMTKEMIDGLKSVCSSFGLGNASAEYKIITEVFLYKFINDRFFYEAAKAYPDVPANSLVQTLTSLSEDEYELLTLNFPASVALLKPGQFLSDLYNQRNADTIGQTFDAVLRAISDENLEVFSVRTGSDEKIQLFDSISTHITESSRRAEFIRAILDRIIIFSFHDAFNEKYDFFAAIFEYLIKDYNKDFGKYAEYYTPHSVATIIARVLAPNPDQNVTIYDPSAGSGTLILALAHQIGEDNCTIYTQDISQKSNEFLRLNLILNNLVHSLPNVVHGDTLLTPMHRDGQEVKKFDYITANPPFKTDFSDTRDTLAGDLYRERFWAGVPSVPKKKKDGMAIYLLFLQHIIHSLKDSGRAAVVVPSGFLTDTSPISTEIRRHLVDEGYLKSVIQMPTNLFATTNTSVSVLFFEKSRQKSPVLLVDASTLGSPVKVDDKLRTIFTSDDEEKIVDTILGREEIPEFSAIVEYSALKEGAYLLKPGLYFKLDYAKLSLEHTKKEDDFAVARQRIRGVLNTLRLETAKNIMIDWFVNFEHFSDELHNDTPYGLIPDSLDLVPLGDLILETIGGEWGNEEKSEKASVHIRCIRGTDIPNVLEANYRDIPVRYVKASAASAKCVQSGDIIIEISGGSPIQSTGRLCLITEELLDDLEVPVLCTNFCRILRPKNTELSEYLYAYLHLLYQRGYFFNLENNTTGIKNLILNAFLQNIRVPIPKDLSLIQKWEDEVSLHMRSFSVDTTKAVSA